MRRRVGAALVVAALALVALAVAVATVPERVPLVDAGRLVWKGLLAAAVVAGAYGAYLLATRAILATAESKRQAHTALMVLRFAVTVAAVGTVLVVATERWLGLLFSLGVVGFAVTFALQQPLFSLIGWVYILVKRPYRVGDRVRIEGAKGDVVDVDFLVTTLWEVGGELVSSNQPSGRIVTLPNSTVLSSQVFNYSWEEFPYVWNELTVQVAYETDLEFARGVMVEEADDFLGDEMAANVQRYREVLRETPVELEVRERPSVNVVQQESWVELRLRYIVHPKRGQAVRNELYERVLERFNEHPDRVAFPVSRNR